MATTRDFWRWTPANSPVPYMLLIPSRSAAGEPIGLAAAHALLVGLVADIVSGDDPLMLDKVTLDNPPVDPARRWG